jgi:hypothetical protein
MSKPKTEAIEILNRGSLLTFQEGDHEQCFGYLMSFDDKGTYDATLGKVNVSTVEADTHNRLLDEALIHGLDENCQVGQSGLFYVGKKDGRPVVHTFIGTLVSDDVSKQGTSITFCRKGKVFRGRKRKDCDLFGFRRIA